MKLCEVGTQCSPRTTSDKRSWDSWKLTPLMVRGACFVQRRAGDTDQGSLGQSWIHEPVRAQCTCATAGGAAERVGERERWLESTRWNERAVGRAFAQEHFAYAACGEESFCPRRIKARIGLGGYEPSGRGCLETKATHSCWGTQQRRGYNPAAAAPQLHPPNHAGRAKLAASTPPSWKQRHTMPRWEAVYACIRVPDKHTRRGTRERRAPAVHRAGRGAGAGLLSLCFGSHSTFSCSALRGTGAAGKRKGEGTGCQRKGRHIQGG